MQPTSHRFTDNAHEALNNETLQQALGNVRVNFIEKRRSAVEALPEFDALRKAGREMRDRVLSDLDTHLLAFEAKVKEHGGHVHWCADAEAARQTVLKICQGAGAKRVTKGKTMIGEEIGINDFLEANHIEPIETDLGEYIIQLRHETPSHLIAPAVHVTQKQVEETFRKAHRDLDPGRNLEEPSSLLAEAREKLRQRFLSADVGITGANFLVAETGTSVIVTNEGNGDLTQTLPRVHIALASIDKVVPTLEDLTVLLRLLARSATGQEMSVYTTLSTGPRRAEDHDGPGAYHVILLDNGRSKLLGTEKQDLLRCIRCGACLNHCPIYHAVGGHAYGWVYGGPIGAALTPALIGLEETHHLPNASTLCGRCEEVCPMQIPIPNILRHWREEELQRGLAPTAMRRGIGIWAFFARRPALYRLATRIGARMLRNFAGGKGRLAQVPMATALTRGWTDMRDLPAPSGRTFHALYRQHKGQAGRSGK
ncbi:MAG TPA: LutB/LldF family L-lactate oxidation iron-sulfur protein [Dongiaceae bacterium]|nr:LutB/LldF family L-lactate oxidation iron-sulfur protein [Dongiaceae bacterium]